jgi:hypothetical protein
MRVNAKIVQLIGDAVIPLLGYFLWDWGLYFIVVFYLIDYIANELFVHFKAKKIAEHSGSGRSTWIGKGILSASLITTVVIVVHAVILKIHPGIDIKQELINFWSYKDMGIEQGYVLLPLIVLVGYQRYKLEFLMPGLFTKLSMESLWRTHLIAHYVLLGMVGILLGLSVIVIMPDAVYLAGIILLTSFYQLFFKQK